MDGIEAGSLGGGRHRRFTVASGSAGQRVAAWQDAMRISGRVEIDEGDAATFEGEIRSLPLNELMAARVTSGRFRFLRGAAEIERLGRETVFLNVVENGRIAGRLAGRPVSVEAGAVLVTRQSVTMDVVLAPGTSWVGLLVPMRRLRRLMHWRASMDAKVFAPGSVEAVMLGSHIRSLMDLPGELSPRQAGRIARASLQFLAAHLGGPARTAMTQADADLAREDDAALAIKRFIADRLSDPELGPEAICLEFGLSRSQLYRMAGEGTGIAASIRRLRLLCAHRDIASGRFPDRAIADIARHWGMPDARSFRRAFTLEFGCAPSTLRDRAASGVGANLPDHTDAPAEIERWFET